MSKGVLSVFSCKSFILPSLIFRPLIHFELIFIYNVREYSDFILLHVAVQRIFLVVLQLRLQAPSAGVPGSIPDQGIRSHIPQVRVHMLQLRVFMLQVKKRSRTCHSYRSCKWFSHSIVSDSLQSHGLQPSRLLCPWDSPVKNTEVDCCSLSQRIFLTQGWNPGLLHCRHILYHLNYRKVLKILHAATKRSYVLQWKLNIGHATTKTRHSQINKQTYSCPVFPAPLIEETVFSPLYILASFVIHQVTIGVWVCLWAFYPSIDLYFCVLCQYHTILITLTLQYSLKLGWCLIPPAPFFFLKIALALMANFVSSIFCQLLLLCPCKIILKQISDIILFHLIHKYFGMYL